MYTSTTATEKARQSLEQLATDVASAIEAEIAATGGLSVFQIATGAGMLPSDLASFLGPDAGGGTYPQHQSMITLAQASQILSNTDAWVTDPGVSVVLDPAAPVA